MYVHKITIETVPQLRCVFLHLLLVYERERQIKWRGGGGESVVFGVAYFEIYSVCIMYGQFEKKVVYTHLGSKKCTNTTELYYKILGYCEIVHN